MSVASTQSPGVEPFVSALARRRLLIVSGKGGVGRSTVALVVAKTLAAQGKRVLLATTGEDDRLAQLSGLSAQGKTLGPDPQPLDAHLSILKLLPARSVREYAEMVLFSRRLARAIFDSKVVRRLLAAVPGMDDFAILGKIWHEATRAANYDHVVFDGPASGHLRTTLRVPQSILDAMSQGPLASEAAAMLESLRSEDTTGLILVGLAQSWPLTELSELAMQLGQAPGMHGAGIVINQMWADDLPEVPDFDAPTPQLVQAKSVLQAVQARGALDNQIVKDWHQTLQGELSKLPLLRVPYAPSALDSPMALQDLMQGLSCWPGEEGAR